MKQKASLRLISEKTGYSRTTVFNVLNGRGGTSKETADRIRKLAEEMQYAPVENRKKIKLVVYKDSGTVVDDTPFFSQLFSGIESECRAHSYSLEIAYIYGSEENYESSLAQILGDGADGIILLGTEMNERTFQSYENTSTPVLMCDNRFFSDKSNCVAINNKDAVEHAVGYLISCGHKKIGYLRGATRINNFRERADGMRAALGKNGLPEAFEYTVTLRPSTDKAYQDMKVWLQQPHEMPTAYFADNDLIAFGAMRALQEAGYRIPEDISVVGFDDMPFCEVFNPPLTTVRVNKDTLGRIAVKRLIDEINNRKHENAATSTITLIGAQLILRSSVKKLNA